MNNVIDFYYFSGTGNTYLVVEEMTKFFEKNKIVVNLKKIEKSDPKKIDTTHTIGLAFPVAMQSTYKFLWEFFENMNISENNTEIFMVDTMAAFSGGIVGHLKKLVQDKGYQPIGAKEIIMPSNLNFKDYNDEKFIVKKENGLHAARKFAHDLYYNVSSWKRVPVVSDLLSKISKSPKPWEFSRKKFPLYVDSNLCLNCGLCYKLCPVDNITDSQIPEMNDSCEYCMRCISFCPAQAIKIKNVEYVQYTAVDAGKLI